LFRFLEQSLQERLESTEANLRQQVGPGLGERWFQWQSANQEQKLSSAARVELERILAASGEHRAHLSLEELTTVRRNLQTNGVDVEADLVRSTWHPVFRRHFLRRSLGRCYDCRRGFYMYNQGLTSELDCNDVVLFWRIQQMLKVTSNALRQQVHQALAIMEQ